MEGDRFEESVEGRPFRVYSPWGSWVVFCFLFFQCWGNSLQLWAREQWDLICAFRSLKLLAAQKLQRRKDHRSLGGPVSRPSRAWEVSGHSHVEVLKERNVHPKKEEAWVDMRAHLQLQKGLTCPSCLGTADQLWPGQTSECHCHPMSYDSTFLWGLNLRWRAGPLPRLSFLGYSSSVLEYHIEFPLSYTYSLL